MLNAVHSLTNGLQGVNTQIDRGFDVSSVNAFSNHLDGVRGQIIQIDNTPLTIGADIDNSEFERLQEQIGQAISQQEVLNRTVDDFDVNKANKSYVDLSKTIGGTEHYIRDNVEEQIRFSREIENSTSRYNGLTGTIIKAAGVLGVGYVTKEFASSMATATMELEATEAKFNTVFNGMTEYAQGFIDEFQMLTPATESSTRAMASGIQDLLVPMGFARDEATKMTGETFQLIGALTNFNSATHTAEDVAGAFQSALTGEYDSLKALGIQIDATTVKEHAVAMGLAKTTEEVSNQAQAMATMDLAYAQSGDALAAYNEESLDTLTRMGILKAGFIDTFGEAGQSLLPKINQALINIQNHMPTIEAGIYVFAGAFGVVIDSASALFDVVMNIAGGIVEHWSIIQPIVIGVAIAVGIYTGALIAYNTVQGVSNGITALSNTLATISAARSAIKAGATIGEAAATTTATGAQIGLNAALLACPITWIVIGVVLLITVFYGVVAAINHFAGTSISATGIVIGAVFALGSFIANQFIFLWNVVGTFINFFANVWNDPISSVKILFLDLSSSVIGYVSTMASTIENVINKIPGVTVDITSGLDGFQSKIEEMSATVKSEAEWNEVVKKMEYIDLGDAYNAGYSLGGTIEEKVSGFLSFDNSYNNQETPDLKVAGLDAQADALKNIDNNTSSLKNNSASIKEEIKYLKDFAYAKAIDRVTTKQEVHIYQTNHNTINSDYDFDEANRKFVDGYRTALENNPEGVHA